MKSLTKNINRGFSLIEVAIAVLVISLVATFSLKGRELVQTAKIRAVIEQVETFRIAVDTFEEKYGALPGDLSNAKDLIDSSLDNGSGNRKFETLSDAKRFWAHLSKAGLINVELVNGLPTSKIGGVFTVSSKIQDKPGIWLVLSNGTADNTAFTGIVSPETAYRIDKSIDTGIPNEGDVQVIKGNNALGECINGSSYVFTNKNEDCVILFKIR
ncbi:MAG: prepilin-type N-terminal cleavage/methylation domain-containing protein [Alphaproteobacteria bacterium]|nr:prepilin-type N-terminal cleavage/methylation domain-containing protein [Alphaproteobacteria bacterium]